VVQYKRCHVPFGIQWCVCCYLLEQVIFTNWDARGKVSISAWSGNTADIGIANTERISSPWAPSIGLGVGQINCKYTASSSLLQRGAECHRMFFIPEQQGCKFRASPVNLTCGSVLICCSLESCWWQLCQLLPFLLLVKLGTLIHPVSPPGPSADDGPWSVTFYCKEND